MHCFEVAHILVQDPVAVAFQRRTCYEGSSASNGIGPVHLVSEANAWVRTFADKKEIYGKVNRIAPGGRTPGIDAATAKKLTRHDKDVEPVFSFSFPPQFYQDVLMCLGARTVTALTIGDGSIALAAMAVGKVFVGVCLTAAHAKALRNHLGNTVFKGFWTEGSPFYDGYIAKELQDAGLGRATAVAIEKTSAGEPTARKTPVASKTPATLQATVSTTGGLKRTSAVASGKGGEQPAKLKKTASATSVAEKMKAALASLSKSAPNAASAEDVESNADADAEDIDLE